MARSLWMVVIGLTLGAALGGAVIALGGPTATPEPPPVAYQPALHPLLVAAGQLLASLAALMFCDASARQSDD